MLQVDHELQAKVAPENTHSEQSHKTKIVSGSPSPTIHCSDSERIMGSDSRKSILIPKENGEFCGEGYSRRQVHELLYEESRRLKMQQRVQVFTKGCESWPSSVVSLVFSKTANGVTVPRQISLCPLSSSLFKVISVISLFLFIVSIPQSTEALAQSRCETHGWSAYPVWKYRARPRYVAPLKMDPEMQREFLRLFRGKTEDSSEEDSDEREPLYIPQLSYIAEMCPRDAFFYSLSPKHIQAAGALANMFIAQPSPPDVLKLAKDILRSKQVNPKVWYHGIVGAAAGRPDMTGFKLAHAVDAMPDIFIPGPLLFDAMGKYRSGLRGRSGIGNRTRTASHRRRAAHRVKRSDTLKTLMHSSFEKITDTFGKIDIGQGSSNSSNKESGRGLTRSKVKRVKTKDDDDNKISKSKKKDKGKGSGKRDELLELFKRNGTSYTGDTGTLGRGRDDHDECIVVDGSIGKRNGIENKLWYFREDMMVSQHHWYWHQEYPLNSTMHRPRRAELFFYMHRNIIARYNAERLSNGFSIVEPFDIRPGAIIRTAYDAQLADVASGKFWTRRPHGVPMSDTIHEKDPDIEKNIFIGYYNRLYWRLFRSIQVGHLLVDKFKTIPILHTKGIEPLANTVEASELNVNGMFYDAFGFHNTGHQIIGLASDPRWERKVPVGVMADTSTTMRDPEFYSFHTLVDNIFDMYKKQLPPYKVKGGEYPLKWDGVEIIDIEAVSRHGGPRNQLRTFWSTRRFELTPGVDQSIHKGDVDVDVCAVHLDHEPFDFKITVAFDPCAKTVSNRATVRIFLAPRYDEHGNRMPLKVQRRLMIHMDAFPVDLRVGRNVILRRSYDSNAIKPWSRSLKEYENAPKHPTAAEYCGCGWPTHLYIPKGSPKGTPFDLFVMLTNYDEDIVDEHPDDLSVPESCNSPYMYCGIPYRQYPDAKPMGYPFDRLPFNVPMKCPPGPIFTTLVCKVFQLFLYKPIGTLDEYVSYAPNMASTVVEIRHHSHLVH